MQTLTFIDPHYATMCDPSDPNPSYSYLFGDQRMDWATANRFCQRLGGHLADIGSAEEAEGIADIWVIFSVSIEKREIYSSDFF